MRLQGNQIYLRALELNDLDFLYELENNMTNWELSNTITPYSRYVLKQYLDNSHKDIYDIKQLRLVICNVEDNEPLGAIDLFEFEPKHRRVGVGIIIADANDRGKGYGKEALELVSNYAFTQLDVHQLYCNISEDNTKSITLFKNAGFVKIGAKQDWNLVNGEFKDEGMYQLLKSSR